MTIHHRRTVLVIVTVVATVALLGALDTRVVGTDAGIDGDHIYAGISYDADDSLQRCQWKLPSDLYDDGVAPRLSVRQWNGLTWYLYICERDGATILVWLPDVSTETVAESARDVVRELVPTLDLGFSPPPTRGLVKTPTWFWVNPVLWRPVSVTARVPTPRGVLTVTTTATPSGLEFHPGDGRGDVVECDGPGLPWTSLLPRFVESECAYEYPIPSTAQRGSVFRARLDVVWDVTWRTNTGTSGRLPDMRTGSNHSLRIRELQALVQK